MVRHYVCRIELHVNSKSNNGKLMVARWHEFVTREEVICDSNLTATRVVHSKQHIDSKMTASYTLTIPETGLDSMR